MWTIVHAVVGCVLFALMLDTWFISGLFVPVVVDSGSMAPGLRGPHRTWTCESCGREFHCGLGSLPAAGHLAVCPGCGAANDPQAGVERPGDRVLVDRAALVWRRPRRFETIVLRCPGRERDWCVKRVLGLPGEQVEIRDGDVWIDGQVAQKTMAEMRDIAVLVHEEPPTTEHAVSSWSRWHDESGRWRKNGAGFVHRVQPDAGNVPTVGWLTYHAGDIFDESPYDQSESRMLNRVNDVLLRAIVKCDATGQLLLRARTRHDEFLVRLELVKGTGRLEHNDLHLAPIHAPRLPAGEPVQVEWMLADRRVQLVFGDVQLLDCPYEPREDLDAPAAPSFAIGAWEAEFEVRQLQVWRDVYYTPGTIQREQQKYRVGPDDYFLLGDNSPHSEDSRSWSPSHAVPASNIIGRLVRW